MYGRSVVLRHAGGGEGGCPVHPARLQQVGQGLDEAIQHPAASEGQIERIA
ncbi:hypothetical protein HUK83_09150 [Endobacter medicaginis]|uniref:Uncharacterized protein n=1 Tax=Endobacter medicaginis TaxID=1181271 RepID=A0A850NX38_9PROT|nr:hypothetical protein [Endobacter medicaginis]NVN30497.1 hypothetical protein [Endobacter medicaginis]